MRVMTRCFVIGFALATVATWALAAAPGTATEDPAKGPAVGTTPVLRVQAWDLLQHDGAQLYQELCASCHGAEGAGYARATPVPTRPLTTLKQRGVPRAHWTYVILAPYEDGHHWAPDGNETMPCWQRIFRQALGHDAGPLLVAKKLTGYLESIQE